MEYVFHEYREHLEYGGIQSFSTCGCHVAPILSFRCGGERIRGVMGAPLVQPSIESSIICREAGRSRHIHRRARSCSTAATSRPTFWRAPARCGRSTSRHDEDGAGLVVCLDLDEGGVTALSTLLYSTFHRPDGIRNTSSLGGQMEYTYSVFTM